jgi:hypothetical protein
MYNTKLAFIAAASVAAACSGEPTGVAAEQQITVESISKAVQTSRAQPVARGIALAMRDAGRRSTLLRAMQASPWSERKLTLQEFAQTKAGEELMSAAAAGIGMETSRFLALVAGLPAMDFYLPFRTHRRSWRGGAELLVGTTFDGDAPELTVYAGDGSTRVLRLADGTPRQPLLLLQPAERKLRWGQTQPRGAPTIESPDAPFVALIEECDPETAIEPCDAGGGGGGGGGVTPGVYITHFHGFDDDGWFGDLEMQFQSHVWYGQAPTFNNSNGTYNAPNQCHLGTASLNWPPHENWNGLRILSPNVTNTASQDCGSGITPHQYFIIMWEIDGDLNGPNEIWGYRFFDSPGSPPQGAQVGVNLGFYYWHGVTSEGWMANLKPEYR